MGTFLNKIKQPAPNITNAQNNSATSEGAQEKKYKIVPAQNVGVIKLPKITKTPITDTIEKKREENPYTIYKLPSKIAKVFNFQTILGLATLVTGTAAFFSLKKNVHPIKKVLSLIRRK